MEHSQYNSTENCKVTYLFGAGASYNAVPIWKQQALSMIEVAKEMRRLVEINLGGSNKVGKNEDYDILFVFFKQMEFFGIKALDFGSIDIYAKRLFLLNDIKELNDLKKCVSVYFDLWESGLLRCSNLENGTYSKIDQRYFNLLSVILERGENSPQFNSNVSFVTWNYDLQLEKAYETFLPTKAKTLEELLDQMNPGSHNNIIHLNGHRGIYYQDGKYLETVEIQKFQSLLGYLKELIVKKEILVSRKECFLSTIKYAWEMDSTSKEKALELMRNTNILVIIGYSFPAFNRSIDQELIKEFEKGQEFKRVIYQDPNANEDIVSSLFHPSKNIKLEKQNTTQFYIPHEFLSPSPGKFFVV